jgi:predicted metal-dependent hydrolase
MPQAENEDMSARMTLRRMPFEYVQEADAHWNKNKPEFSQVVNSASMAMPYLEPYLIRTMRKARPDITDPQLQEALDAYVFQEAQHYQQHRKYNDSISAAYVCAKAIEERLAEDYKKLERDKSLRFNLAYAEGFESMALALGHMLIEDRETLFGDADSTVASLILWHFIEEIEHKNVAFDVYEHLHGSYFWRMVGLVYATVHIFWRTGQGYRSLLREDGLWNNLRSRKRHMRGLLRIFRQITPKWLRIWKPGYHPSQIEDAQWGLDWAAIYTRDPQQSSKLDTTRFKESQPIPLST